MTAESMDEEACGVGDASFKEKISHIITELRASPSTSGAQALDLQLLRSKLAVIGLIASGDQGERCHSYEEIKNWVEEQFLTPDLQPRSRDLVNLQVHWDRSASIQPLLPVALTPQTVTLDFVCAGLDGRTVGTRENMTHEPVTSKAKARQRHLDQKHAQGLGARGMNFVRGRSGGNMFLPGGLNDADLAFEEFDETTQPKADDGLDGEVQRVEEAIKVWGRGMRTIAPGLSRAFRPVSGKDISTEDEDQMADHAGEDTSATLGMRPVPQYQPSATPSSLKIDGVTTDQQSKAVSSFDQELDELLPTDRPQLGSTQPKVPAVLELERRDWAHVVDANKRLANFNELVPDMAHKYPFTLDPFQQEAVYHLEQGDCVFVAAHTSAGKTVVAEYAIALAQKHMTRCIYTSPIKALSNQKFRDFKQTFGAENVGILTGDVQINPEAPCLIMTTEILRSMLYRGADLIRDVEFVIFDEVHYVNDQERGVVWEEVIILCPQHISLILLSATVPNTKEFADWVGRTKKKDIYVISTSKRPVPLEHYLYASKDLHKIVDSKSKFMESGIKEANDALKRKQDKEREAAGIAQPTRQGARGGSAGGANSRGGRGAAAGTGAARGGRGGGSSMRGRGGRGGGSSMRGRGGGSSIARTVGSDTRNMWVHLVGLLKKKDLLPVVAFVFSKRRCEEYANSLPNTDLSSAREKSEAHIVIERSIARLKGTDKDLPQIQRMRDLLARGIAVHHGGLLPIVKEIVELLFQRGLVKVLFATETFAMGVNMPARSVVFSGIRKHDGHGFRELLAGEYTQMSGRAGRRGLDATGTVIINAADEVPETAVLHKMLLGQPTKLQSQFRLTYNMILNLLRVETLKVEEMIKRSFSENASQRLLPDQQKKIEQARERLGRLPHVQPQDRKEILSQYYDHARLVVISNHSVMDLALEQQQGSKILSAGRIVLLRSTHFDFDPAVVVKQVASREFLVLAAVPPERKSGKFDLQGETVAPRWPPPLAGLRTKDGGAGEFVYDLHKVDLVDVSFITKHTIKIEQSMVMAHRRSAMNRTVQLMLPLIDEMARSRSVESQEIDWTRFRRLDFQEAVKIRNDRICELMRVSLEEDAHFAKQYRLTHARKQLEREIARIEVSMSNQNLELLPDYEQRVEVLKTLRFIDPANESVLLKGRVACEINSADELVLTELILDNVFSAYTPSEIVALLSVFVFQEKTDNEPQLTERLQEGLSKILATAERVSQIQAEHQLNFEDYANSLSKIGLVEVVYSWAEGVTFEEITRLTDVQEGSIVRVMTRLEQTVLEVRDAARVVGDLELKEKMEDAQVRIKRDILAAPSLYF